MRWTVRRGVERAMRQLMGVRISGRWNGVYESQNDSMMVRDSMEGGGDVWSCARAAGKATVGILIKN